MNTLKNQGAIVDIANLKVTLPPLPTPWVDRSNLVETIAQIPSKDAPIVLIDVNEGEGATTLLTQFVLSYPNQVFSLFIKPASRFSYTPDYLRLLLAEQYWWFLYGKRLDLEQVDASLFESLQLRVRQRIKSGFMYFVVDGLHQIPLEDAASLRQILREVMPIGTDYFRFIVTGSAQSIGKHIPTSSYKEYRLVKFSDSESTQLLEDLPINSQQLIELKKICKGIPGRLSAVRRLVLGGVDPEEILKSDPTKYLEFVRLEFDPVDNLTEMQKLIIAVFAFTRHNITTDDILDILPNSTELDVKIVQDSCTFLVSSNKQTEFTSETHRLFAQRLLEKYKRTAIGSQVDQLILNPKSSAAVRFLPTYYQTLNQQQAIIDLISHDHYLSLLEETQSLAILRSRAAMGARSAMDLKRTSQVLRFALQKSIFSAANIEGEFKSEIGALITLGESHRALEIASGVVSKEQRLLLLAEYARKLKERGQIIDHEVINYINELATQIDFSDFGEGTISLAENLLFVDPDLALGIVEKFHSSEQHDEKNATYVHLSLAATVSRTSDKAEINAKARSKISDESLQSLLSSLSSIFSNFTYEEIIATAGKMRIDRRIYFLRNLISTNTNRPNVLDVVDFALDELIKNTTYVPKAKDLADLAAPLSNPDYSIRAQQIVKRIDGQVGLIERTAPSVDATQLQLKLAGAEMNFDPHSAEARIADIYLDVASISDIETRVTCLANMIKYLAVIDTESVLENRQGFRQVIRDELLAGTGALLKDSATQFEILEPALLAIAEHNFHDALDVVKKLNTLDRRNDGYALVAKVLAGLDHTDERSSTFLQCLSCIQDIDKRDHATLSAFRILSRLKAPSQGWVTVAKVLLSQLHSPLILCKCCIELIEILHKTECLEEISSVIQIFDASVLSLDFIPDSIDLHFDLASKLGTRDLTLARKYYEAGASLRQSTKIRSKQTVDTLGYCLSLLLRSLRPLARADLISDDILVRFSAVVDLLPSSEDRAAIYSDLATKAWCENKIDFCRKIVNEKCMPLLAASGAIGSYNYQSVAYLVLPALYCSHKATAFAVMGHLSDGDKNMALHTIAMMLIYRTAPSEPWPESDNDAFKINHETMVDLVEILGKITIDSTFYGVLRTAVTSIADKENRSRVTGQQRADFVSNVQELVTSKLPDKQNISHNGYALACTAALLRLSVDIRRETWLELVAKADAIENAADKCYVLLEIARSIPSRLSDIQKQILARSHALVHEIPSARDRYSRLTMYINAARSISPSEAKVALKDAFSMTLSTYENEDAAKHQRRLMDIAEMIHPDLVDELIEMIDDDPARAKAKEDAKHLADVQKLKRNISGAKSKTDANSLKSDCLPAAAWKNVAALVANRLEPKSPDSIAIYVDAAGNFSLHDAFPVISWYIENSARRYTSSTDVSRLISPLAEILLLSTEIAVSVISHPSGTRRSLEPTTDMSGPKSALVVKAGERSSAVAYIKDWVRTQHSSHIILCDAYFSVDDIEFLRVVLAENPHCKITIITSKKHAKGKLASFDAESFFCVWRQQMDQDPPPTEIIAPSANNSDDPLIHDRWLLSDASGLRMGTSFKSLGLGKISELSILTSNERAEVLEKLDPFLRKERFIDGRRINYVTMNV